MSRSATATTAAAAFRQHERERRRVRPPAVVARRVSGAVRPPTPPADGRALAMSEGALAPRPRAAARPPLRLAAGGAAIALRVAETAVEVSGSRTMDRLVRSRAWVLIIGFGLIGIVAMQVSMLKLNAGISRAADTVTTLERNNQALKAQVSTLSSGDRIQALAAQRGFVMPEPADVTYLRAGDARETAARAAGRMQSPDKSIAGPAGSVTVAAAAAAAAEAKVAADAAAAQVATAPTIAATTAPPASTTPATPVPTGAAATAAATPPAATATAAGGAAPQTGVTLP